MAFSIDHVQVWSGDLPDRPGAAAAKLEVLARAGADVEFIFTRPHARRPDTQVIFVAPVSGPEQTQAAQEAGLQPGRDALMLRVRGDNRPGIGFELMSQLAVAGINLQGLSISTVDNRFVAYLAFGDADQVALAVQVLATLA